MKTLHFTTKTAIVPDACVNGMAEVFHDVDTIDVSHIDETCVDMIEYIAPVWNHPHHEWKARLDPLLDTLPSAQLIALLSFANFVGHDLIIDRAAAVIAARLDTMSFGDMAELFGTESRIPESMVYKHIHADVPDFV